MDFDLDRSALGAVAAAILQIAVLVPTAGAGPVSKLEPNPAELLSEASPHAAGPASHYSGNAVPAEYPPYDRLAELPVQDIPAVRAPGDLFESRELELNVLDDKYKSPFVLGSCLYPDTALRGFGESAEDCRFIKPGEGTSSFFNLPLLAISGWALIILGIAGLHYFYGYWRVWRWLRRLRAAGLVPRTAKPRRPTERGARRSSSRARTRRRRYAG